MRYGRGRTFRKVLPSVKAVEIINIAPSGSKGSEKFLKNFFVSPSCRQAKNFFCEFLPKIPCGIFPLTDPPLLCGSADKRVKARPSPSYYYLIFGAGSPSESRTPNGGIKQGR